MARKDLVEQAMRLECPERYPVMCQLANGHTILNTGVHPIDYFVDNDVWADCLLRMRELYDFDGILCHKPGRTHNLMDLVERSDYDAEIPTLYLFDGSRIECTRDDDAYYKSAADFVWPTLEELDPNDLLGWAPASFVAFQVSKGTIPTTDPEAFDDHVFAMIDRVIAKAGQEFSVHGEVRSPFDHFLNLTGMEDGLCSLMDDPEKCQQILGETTKWSIALALAQIRRGASAIKISSPFAGSAFLSRQMYTDFILPFESQLATAVRKEGAPIYTHTCGAIGDRLDLIAETGVSGIECLDPPPLGDVDINQAVDLLQNKMFIKGNLDPVNTLLRGDSEIVRGEVNTILHAADKTNGFILSSACSVAPPTSPDNMKLIVELCHEYQRS
jgi:uroporphyrinogen-III decarboxylase